MNATETITYTTSGFFSVSTEKQQPKGLSIFRQLFLFLSTISSSHFLSITLFAVMSVS